MQCYVELGEVFLCGLCSHHLCHLSLDFVHILKEALFDLGCKCLFVDLFLFGQSCHVYVLLYSFLQDFSLLPLFFGQLPLLFLLGQIWEVIGRGYEIEQQIMMPTMREGTAASSS